MPSYLSYKDITTTITDGIQSAFKTYYKWTDGMWLYDAPESIMVLSIADKIMKMSQKKGYTTYLTLEESIKGSVLAANKNRKGPISNKLRPNGRGDIVLWRATSPYPPRAVIEIKKYFGLNKSIKEDIDRLCHFLLDNNDSSIEYTIFGFYTSSKRNKTIVDRRGKLEEHFSKVSKGKLDCEIEFSKCCKPEEGWQGYSGYLGIWKK